MKLLQTQFLALATLLALTGDGVALDVIPSASAATVPTAEEARAIAKEAYIYAYSASRPNRQNHLNDL
jgi:hypothetical protein